MSCLPLRPSPPLRLQSPPPLTWLPSWPPNRSPSPPPCCHVFSAQQPQFILKWKPVTPLPDTSSRGLSSPSPRDWHLIAESPPLQTLHLLTVLACSRPGAPVPGPLSQLPPRPASPGHSGVSSNGPPPLPSRHPTEIPAWGLLPTLSWCARLCTC